MSLSSLAGARQTLETIIIGAKNISGSIIIRKTRARCRCVARVHNATGARRIPSTLWGHYLPEKFPRSDLQQANLHMFRRDHDCIWLAILDGDAVPLTRSRHNVFLGGAASLLRRRRKSCFDFWGGGDSPAQTSPAVLVLLSRWGLQPYSDDHYCTWFVFLGAAGSPTTSSRQYLFLFSGWSCSPSQTTMTVWMYFLGWDCNPVQTPTIVFFCIVVWGCSPSQTSKKVFCFSRTACSPAQTTNTVCL